MNKLQLVLLVTILYCCSIPAIVAQDAPSSENSAVKVIARTYGDSIVLRWAPLNPQVWEAGNEVGYQLIRYTILRNGEMVSYQERSAAKELLVEPLRPLPLSDWEPLTERDDYAAIAAQAIFGGSFEVSGEATDLMAISNMEKELQNRFGFSLFAADQSPAVAVAMGLGFTDHNIKKGEKYLYRIFLGAEVPNLEIDTGFVFVGTDEIEPLPKPLEARVEWGDSTAMISWNQAFYRPYYSSYIVERSDDGGSTFQKSTETPLVSTSVPGAGDDRMYFVDHIPDNENVYIYQVRGRSYFGDYGPPSDAIQGKGIPEAIQAFPSLQKIDVLENGLEVKWTFPDHAINEVSGFEIIRSDRDNGEYQLVSENMLPAETRTFLDTDPLPVNYYKVVVVDKNDNKVSSFSALAQPNDSIPPLTPVNIVGVADEKGNVVLNWEKGKEKDLYGYRVFYASNKDDEFAQITKRIHKDTTYQYKLSETTVTEEAYFKVRAFDFRENGSGFSGIVIVKRPDNLASTAPVFRELVASDTGVYVTWVFSSSLDVTKHELQRKPVFSREWEVVQTYEYDSLATYGECLDSLASYKYLYHYRLVAFDDDGLFSYSKKLETKPIDNGIRPPLENIVFEADRREKAAVLTWDYPMDEKPEKFLIYRLGDDGILRTYVHITAAEMIEKGNEDFPYNKYEFKDKKVRMDTPYTYHIQAIYTNGAMSHLTEPLLIEY